MQKSNDILSISTAFWRSAVLFHALKMNLFLKMGSKISTSAEIAQICGVKSEFSSRLLRALAAMGLLNRNGDEYSCNELILEQLVPGRGKNLSHFCQIMSEDFSSGMWARFPSVPSDVNLSTNIVQEQPAYQQTFAIAMQNLALRGEAQALTGAFILEGKKRLLDIGGGVGWYSIALCRKNPQLQAVVIDLPHTIKLAKKIIAENEMDERIEATGKNWTQLEFDNAFDAVLLSDVLYEEEPACGNLLQTAFNALQPGGIAALRGYFMDDSDDRLFAALFDINLMMSNPRHRTYNVNQIMSWLEEIGFTQIEARPLTELSYFISAAKPKEDTNK